MGKRTTIEADKQATDKAIRIPAKSTIKAFNGAFNEAKETIDEANEQLKKDADEAKAKHLNLWAFKVCKKLYDDFHAAENEVLASQKLAVKLANLDECRKHFDLDGIANLQGRLFGEGPIGSTPERETDEDGEPDMRPTHLRQPGASVTNVNPVADLAAKSGAKTQASDPLSQVGRGSKPN